ncbi:MULTISPECIES: ArsR/SmtB family transcription factor [Microbacterium]|uniref:DNA-binding transcriptional regulator, ArsR family n=1 Tax=Microbacterium saccharophilum TaxID=1213358 RepID=A0A7Z7CWP7_9MICO|nr:MULTISPECIES: metalloregulator ArsR/SmtB family transcription factor [Microbacterium]SFI34317.1 DNA-binding transcriptional regulator, ArsR family [Microbacterium saccharophilum]
MNAFEILADPVRRRILELLSAGECTAGELTAAVRDEFGISQPAVSNQLRVLRDSGFARDERRGSHRLYALRDDALDEVTDWIDRYRGFWRNRLDALETELARGARDGGDRD